MRITAICLHNLFKCEIAGGLFAPTPGPRLGQRGRKGDIETRVIITLPAGMPQ